MKNVNHCNKILSIHGKNKIFRKFAVTIKMNQYDYSNEKRQTESVKIGV
jgi:hypothetical protein